LFAPLPLQVFNVINTSYIILKTNITAFLVSLIILLQACAHQFPPPKYYTTPEAELTESRILQTVVKPDSLNLQLLEWAVFYETNLQRNRFGLLPLRYEGNLQHEARSHSQEMVQLQYFDHVSPVDANKTVKERLKNAGINHGGGGENIAIHPVRKKQHIVFRVLGDSQPSKYNWRNSGTVYTYEEFAQDLVERFLNSAPHRHNILNSAYQFLGVGAAPAQYHHSSVLYVTQNFSSTNY